MGCCINWERKRERNEEVSAETYFTLFSSWLSSSLYTRSVFPILVPLSFSHANIVFMDVGKMLLSYV